MCRRRCSLSESCLSDPQRVIAVFWSGVSVMDIVSNGIPHRHRLDRQIVEIDDKDPIFHVIYDLDDRYQVPGLQYLYTHSMFEYDGFQAKWRGVYDDHGRLMVAICHNMDLGDAWENSDDPRYPEKFAALAYRIAVNYWTYDLTH